MRKNNFNKSVSTITDNSLPLLNKDKEKSNKKNQIFLKHSSFVDLDNICNSDYKRYNNGRYYYKNPQFLNSLNIQNQINILKTNINNNNSFNTLKNHSTNSLKKLPKLKSLINLDNYLNLEQENSLRTSCNSPTNNKNKNNNNINRFKNMSKSSSKNGINYINNYSYDANQKRKEANYVYKNIFPNSPLFKEKIKFIDNKFNLVYCQNEEQYKFIMEKRNKLMKNKGTILKFEEDSEKIKGQVEDIKTKIKFMKNIMDYSYPGFMLTKIKSWGKNLSSQKIEEKKTPIDILNSQIKRRNILRSNYLKQNINIYRFKI